MIDSILYSFILTVERRKTCLLLKGNAHSKSVSYEASCNHSKGTTLYIAVPVAVTVAALVAEQAYLCMH